MGARRALLAKTLQLVTDLASDQIRCASKSRTPLWVPDHAWRARRLALMLPESMSPTIPANLTLLANQAPIRLSVASLAMGTRLVILSSLLLSVTGPVVLVPVLVDLQSTQASVMAHALETMHATV